jgi:CBS domain-containing protein
MGLTSAGIYAMMGLFLVRAANASVRYTELRDTLGRFLVRHAMNPHVVFVDPDVTLDRLVRDGFARVRTAGFPVVRDGRLVGIVTDARVRQVPVGRWFDTRVGDVAAPAGPGNTIAHDAILHEAYRRMTQDELHELAVVDGAGRLAGSLSRGDIIALLRLRAPLGPLPQLPPQAPRPAIPLDD